MTRKRFRKLYYSWIIKNRDYVENLGEALKSTRKVGFSPATLKPNYSYQRAWNILNEPITIERMKFEE